VGIADLDDDAVESVGIAGHGYETVGRVLTPTPE
jgi:hypothetical protein